MTEGVSRMSAQTMIVLIDVLGGVLQLCAAGMALSLIRLSGRHWAWTLVTCALVLQAWRRLYVILNPPSPIHTQESLTALLVSLLMLLGVIGIRQVFLQLAQAQSKLEHLAQSDSLTGLPNRTTFISALERETSRVQRGSSGVVLFADIDNFKVCNDSRGHAFGDAVLRDVADAFRAQIRHPDIVARIGGDEFGVVLDESNLDAGRAAANRLRAAVRDVGERAGVPLDLSVGVVGVPSDLSAEDVLAQADREMYASKRSARTSAVDESS